MDDITLEHIQECDRLVILLGDTMFEVDKKTIKKRMREGICFKGNYMGGQVCLTQAIRI